MFLRVYFLYYKILLYTVLSKIHRFELCRRAVDGPSVSDIAVCSIVLRLKFCVRYIFRMNQKRVSNHDLNFDTT
jgi:hypothetical protein